MNERREMILKAAEQLLQHYGVNKTTVADIARAAEVGVGTVYLEFRSKDQLILELSIERYELVLKRMRQAAMGDGTLGERATSMFDARMEAFWEFQGRGAHAIDLVHCRCDAVAMARRRFDAAQRDLLVDFVQGGIDSGCLQKMPAQAMVSGLLLAYTRFSPPLLFQLEPESAREAIKPLHQLVRHGLLRESR